MNSSSENLISYEISSDQEGDDDDHQKDDSSTNEEGGGGGTTKRSYECTFCKRGFTNAQALGGHMNIHRKDRAKAKQVLTPNTSSSSVFPNIPNQFTNDESIMGAFPFASSDQPNIRNHHHHPVSEESQRNFDMYSFHQPAPAPAPAHAHAFPYDPFHNPIVRSSWPMHLNQELRGANLSLRIGPSHDVGHNTHDHQIRTTTENENEVDLELRLGHDP